MFRLNVFFKCSSSTDPKDLRGPVFRQNVAKVQDASGLRTGDGLENPLPTKGHLQVHLLAAHLQGLAVLQRKVTRVVGFRRISSAVHFRRVRTILKMPPTVFSAEGQKARIRVCFSPGLRHLKAFRMLNTPWVSSTEDFNFGVCWGKNKTIAGFICDATRLNRKVQFQDNIYCTWCRIDLIWIHLETLYYVLQFATNIQEMLLQCHFRCQAGLDVLDVVYGSLLRIMLPVCFASSTQL